MESQSLVLVSSGGREQRAVMRRWNESPENEDEVLIEVVTGDILFRGGSDRGFFHAFCEVRRQLESIDCLPRCFAACENVYPSPLIESMGWGERAYLLTLGEQASMGDLVEIFEPSKNIVPVSVERQRIFYERWLASL